MDSQTLKNLLSQNSANINKIAMDILESKDNIVSEEDLFSFFDMVKEEQKLREEEKGKNSSENRNNQQQTNFKGESKSKQKEIMANKLAESLVSMIKNKLNKNSDRSSINKIADVLVSMIVEQSTQSETKEEGTIIPYMLMDSFFKDIKNGDLSDDKISGYNLIFDQFRIYCPLECPFKSSCKNFNPDGKIWDHSS